MANLNGWFCLLYVKISLIFPALGNAFAKMY